MLARTQTKRILTLALALVLMLCWVPFFASPVKAAEPVAYSYNGVVLPSLYDFGDAIDDYEYWYIAKTSSGDYCFLALPFQLEYGYCCSSHSGPRYYHIIPKGNLLYYCTSTYLPGSFAWDGLSTLSIDATDANNHWAWLNIVWGNCDIYNSSGDIHLAASSPVRPGAVSGVDFSRTPSSCYAGMSIGVSIDVTGTGDFEPDCVLTVTGNTSENTYVELDDRYETPNLYYLYVGADETAEELTLTAVSRANTDVRATHTVTVMHLPPPDETTPEEDPVPSTPEGEEPIPTEENPTEPGEIPGGDDEGDSEKNEAVGEGNTSVDDLTEIIPDYSEGFIQALQNFAGAMSYTGTEAKLTIPAVMFPQLGDLVPGFQMMEEMELDFETYVGMMPENLMTLVRSLFTVALIVFCFKELYGTISYALTLKGGIE